MKPKSWNQKTWNPKPWNPEYYNHETWIVNCQEKTVKSNNWDCEIGKTGIKKLQNSEIEKLKPNYCKNKNYEIMKLEL